MFNFIRNHNKAIQMGMMVLVLPGFVLLGVDGFSKMGEKSETVAKVANQNISQLEWDAAVKEDVERVRSSAPNLDPKVFDTYDFKYAALERLVRQRVLAVAAKNLHMGVSDQRLATELLQNPSLASLRKPDGKIDNARYKELLAPQGLTPESFEAKVRSDLSVQQVLSSLGKSGMVPASLADVALNAYFEKREVQILAFAPNAYAKQINPTAEQVESFYKGNSNLFQATEKASIEYVVLDVASILKTITVTEADAKSYYEQNAARLSGTEERKASHILIASAASSSAADRQKAKKEAEELLAQVKKAPATFADIAKKHSQDSASAVNGGDLGFFAKGAMVKAFEDAAFALQPKQISEVVESDFGYHIIQLSEIKAPKTKSFAEMRTEIDAELKKQQAQKKYAEAADTFTNMVYEQSDSLKPVADKLKLEIKTAQNVTRQATPDVKGPLANTKFLSVLFAADTIQKKRNTEAVEMGGSQLVAGRMVQYTPAQTIPFAEVKDKAEALLVDRLSTEQARKEGLAKLAQLQAKPDDTPAELGKPIKVSRDAPAEQNIKLIDAVLRTSTAKLPTWMGVDLGAEGYRVVKLIQAVEGAQVLASQNRDQYLQLWSGAEGNSYYAYLKEKFKVQMKAPKTDPKAEPKSDVKTDAKAKT